MAVQAGEGTIEIIYGSTSIPAGPRTYGGYLARPNGQAEWPTVLIYGPSALPSPSIKNICRVFARHGIAALAPDLEGDPDADLRIGRAIVDFIGAPNGDWSNAEYGFGVIGFETGAEPAGALAASDADVLGVGVVGAELTEGLLDAVDLSEAPILYVASRGDEAIDISSSLAAQDRLPQATFVVYADGPTGFWNDDADGFRFTLYDDTLDRLIAFFGKHLPSRI